MTRSSRRKLNDLQRVAISRQSARSWPRNCATGHPHLMGPTGTRRTGSTDRCHRDDLPTLARLAAQVMTDDNWGSWDGDEDDAYHSVGGDDEVMASDLDALPDYVPSETTDLAGDGSSEPGEVDAGGEEDPGLTTLTNPPGTVAVTVNLDGRVHHFDLAPETARMSEQDLAEEIRIIADLARQQVRSEVREFAVEAARFTGLDPVSMGESLGKIGMPSQTEYEATRSQIFATRYYGATD